MNLKNLIKRNESNWLDFKSQWPDHTAEFVFDILCMANSDSPNDRFIVYGYDESLKKIVDDNKRKWSNDNIFDILDRANFSNIPEISINTITVDGKKLDIITISKTNKRPYFLTKDMAFTTKGNSTNRIIRAGVVYTRTGSKNTAHNESATENQISEMWRERFGLNLSPKERLQTYIKDTKNWPPVDNPLNDNSLISFYYSPFPEFTISFVNVDYADYDPKFCSSNYFGKTIGSSADSHWFIKYHDTILMSGSFSIMDNHRNMLIAPQNRFVWYKKAPPEIHVETRKPFVTDTGYGAKAGPISKLNDPGSGYCRAHFGYHVKDSFEYYLQSIIDPKAYKQIHFYPYDSEELTNKIYLINSEKSIESFIRVECVKLLKFSKDPNPPHKI